MSRGSEHQDRIPNLVMRRQAGLRFEMVLMSMPERDLEILSVLLTGADTVEGLAARFGWTPSIVRFRYENALQKLRHPSRAKVLSESLPEDQRITSTALRDLAQSVTGRFEAPLQRCGHCEAPIVSEATTGRPRRWCSNRCRQAAYNERRRLARYED